MADEKITIPAAASVGASTGPIMSYESVSSVTAATTIVLTAAQLATGIISAIFSGNPAYTIALPSGADIAANPVLSKFDTAGAVFKVLFVVNGSFGNGGCSIASNMGCTVSGPPTLVPGFSRIVYFIANGNSTWNVY